MAQSPIVSDPKKNGRASSSRRYSVRLFGDKVRQRGLRPLTIMLVHLEHERRDRAVAAMSTGLVESKASILPEAETCGCSGATVSFARPTLGRAAAPRQSARGTFAWRERRARWRISFGRRPTRAMRPDSATYVLRRSPGARPTLCHTAGRGCAAPGQSPYPRPCDTTPRPARNLGARRTRRYTARRG